MRMIVCFVTLLLAALPAAAQPSPQQGQATFGGFGQGPGQRPAGDAAPPATGTSRIRGRVIAGDTGRPLRRVNVRVTAPELREMRSVSTDADGRYEFKDLPAGRYMVTATKNGYVQISYGQTRPNEGGKPLQLNEAQTVERIDFALPRGAVIAGRVIDEYGEPVANATVQALQFRFMNGVRGPVAFAAPSMTWD